MTDFFKHGNKVYSENLNDGILVGNSFDWTVNISLPGDTGGVFPNTTTVVKAKVADVYATPNSNLSIGETITNNAGSSQVYRLTVYPNFNRFGGFTFVSLEGDGSVIITEKGGTSPVRNNLDYTNLGSVTELKTLKEYDIVVTIPSGGVVTGLGFGFKSSSADVTASINQSNVTGLVSDLSSLESGKADTEHTHTKSEITDFPSILVTSLTVSDYNPNIDSTVTLTVTVKDEYNHPVVGEEVTVTASDGDFTQLDGSAITAASSVTGTTNNSGQFTLTYTCSEWGLITFSANNTSNQIRVSGWRQLKTFGTTGVVKTNGEYVYIYCADSISNVTSRQKKGIGTVTTGYEPPSVFAVEASQDQSANHKFIVDTTGNISVSNATTSTTSIQVFNSILYPLI